MALKRRYTRNMILIQVILPYISIYLPNITGG